MCGSLLVSISVCALCITDTPSADAFPLDGTESSWGTELGDRELACSELVINSFKHNHPRGESVPLVPQYTEEENEAIEVFLGSRSEVLLGNFPVYNAVVYRCTVNR